MAGGSGSGTGFAELAGACEDADIEPAAGSEAMPFIVASKDPGVVEAMSSSREVAASNLLSSLSVSRKLQSKKGWRRIVSVWRTLNIPLYQSREVVHVVDSHDEKLSATLASFKVVVEQAAER